MRNRRIYIRKPQTGTATSSSQCRELIWVDARPLRESEQKRCQQAYRQLENSRKKFEEYESKSLPEFRQWLHARFGDLLSQLREADEKAYELRALIDAVEGEAYLSGCSLRKAHKKILKMKKQFEKAYSEQDQEEYQQTDDETSEGRDGQQSQKGTGQKQDTHDQGTHDQDTLDEESIRSAFESFFGTRKQSGLNREEYEAVYEEFKNDFGFSKEQEKQRHQTHSSGDKTKKSHKKSQQSDPPPNQNNPQPDFAEKSPISRLKELYRLLARKLHPDLNTDLHAKQLDLWHHVQQAYERHDLERLETLSALSDLYDNSWHQQEGISTLRKLFQELKSALKQLEKKIRSAKMEPSWNFHEKAKDRHQLEIFERRIRKDLSGDLRQVQDQVRYFEDLIESW